MSTASTTAPRAESDKGVRLIVAYKLIKATVSLVGCAVLVILIASGRDRALHVAAVAMRDHVAHAPMIRLGRVLAAALAPRAVHVLALGLGLEGAVTFFEGWALHRRRWWAPWLIVCASGSLIPFEAFALTRHFHPTRVLLLALNLAVVLYLANHARHHGRRRLMA